MILRPGPEWFQGCDQNRVPPACPADGRSGGVEGAPLVGRKVNLPVPRVKSSVQPARPRAGAISRLKGEPRTHGVVNSLRHPSRTVGAEGTRAGDRLSRLPGHRAIIGDETDPGTGRAGLFCDDEGRSIRHGFDSFESDRAAPGVDGCGLHFSVPRLCPNGPRSRGRCRSARQRGDRERQPRRPPGPGGEGGRPVAPTRLRGGHAPCLALRAAVRPWPERLRGCRRGHPMQRPGQYGAVAARPWTVDDFGGWACLHDANASHMRQVAAHKTHMPT